MLEINNNIRLNSTLITMNTWHASSSNTHSCDQTQLDPLINSIHPLYNAQHSSIYVNIPSHLRLKRSPQQTLQQQAEHTRIKRINKQKNIKVNNVEQPTSSVKWKPLIATVQSLTQRHWSRQHTQHTLLYLPHSFLCQTPFLPTASLFSLFSPIRLPTMQKECKRPWGCE